jgi:hypothetical protein
MPHVRFATAIVISVLWGWGGTAVQAQESQGATAWAPRAGSALLDRRLADINAYAARYPDAFIDELVRYQEAPRTLLAERLGKGGLMPADAYYACLIARVTGRPCRSVLDAWDRRGADGWAELAARLGVAPGSPQQARVRKAIEASYGRWSRPLPGPAPAGRPAPGKDAERAR